MKTKKKTASTVLMFVSFALFIIAVFLKIINTAMYMGQAHHWWGMLSWMPLIVIIPILCGAVSLVVNKVVAIVLSILSIIMSSVLVISDILFVFMLAMTLNYTPMREYCVTPIVDVLCMLAGFVAMFHGIFLESNTKVNSANNT